jgi:hypothetical protein
MDANFARAAKRLYLVDDKVANFTDKYTNAKSLYSTNKDIIQGAWDAMAGATGTGRTIDDWIGESDRLDLSWTSS